MNFVRRSFILMDIATIMQRQAAANEQILITLKQVSLEIETFGAVSESIFAAFEKLE